MNFLPRERVGGVVGGIGQYRANVRFVPNLALSSIPLFGIFVRAYERKYLTNDILDLRSIYIISLCHLFSNINL